VIGIPAKKYKSNTAISTYDFLQKFSNEKTAIEYLENQRWRGGIKCPRCSSENTSNISGTTRAMSDTRLWTG
jgi:transposase-like protein